MVAKLDRVAQIAMIVRRFQVLADPIFNGATLEEVGERIPWLAEVGRDPTDLIGLIGREPVDMICAAVLRRFRKTLRGAEAVLDVLDVLDQDRKVALYFALPAGPARRVVERHPNFGADVQPYRDGIEEALFDLDHLFDAMLKGAAEALATGDPERMTRYVPPRFHALIPSPLRLMEAR
jgi:hypothetical protein